ncbi:MAG: hypothetical protein Phog2KO_25130 [Phototrophicaceae bacterium]
MQNKENRRVLIDPILLVLKSRRVIIALVSLVLSIAVLAVPSLEPLHSDLLVLVTSLALILIGGLSVEDAVIASKQGTTDASIREQIDRAVLVILDEMLAEAEANTWASGNIENTEPDYTPN